VSAGSDVAVLVPSGSTRTHSRRAATVQADRPLVRLCAFGALGLYGTLRWATLMTPAPVWRLLGLLGLSLVIVGAGTALRGRGRLAVALLALLSLLAAFAFAGVPWSWVRHFRIAVTADGISEGLSGLPQVLLPYIGINQWIRTVMVLGAGVLLLDAALIVALAPRQLSDGRRAAAATALIALAVVPSTLVRPELPYLQGLILFLLVAAFMWADRIRQGDLVTATLLALLAGAAAMIAAPRLDTHTPWLNYQALAGNLAPAHPESFDWTQRYGPLQWPQHGKAVLEVQARHPDYWKAEDLDVFDGHGWVAQSVQAPDAQGTVPPANLQKWTQTLHVTLRGLNTTNVIAAGVAAEPTHVTSLVAGLSEGTWVDPTGLGPGDSYDVSAYDPQPTAAQLAAAGTNYPPALLPAYLSLVVPSNPGFSTTEKGALPVVPSYQQVFFAPFGSRIAVAYSPSTPNPAVALAASPYRRVYALARRLARHAATPYDYALSVKRYLDSGAYTYNQDPPSSRYPLETFLFGDKIGYCQQFAGSMALLLRMGGVPARVATGFTTGQYDSATKSYIVADTDAHAWVEAWFPSYGWVRFDPTPAIAPALGGHVPLSVVQGSTKGTGTTPTSHGLRSVTGRLPATTHPHSGGTPVAALIALAVVLVLLAVAVRITVRLNDPTNDQLLAELELAFARSGRRMAAGATLAGLEQRLGGSPDAQAYVRTIRLARFAGGSGQPSRAQRRALRSQLRSGLGVIGAVRALWALPPRFRLRLPALERPRRGLHSV
jgi:protein-glutamine gamma-glutamyltransferase